MKGSKVGLLRSYSSELLLPVLLGLRGVKMFGFVVGFLFYSRLFVASVIQKKI
jgi:hypothetical protein